MALTSAWYNMYQSLNWLLSVSVVRAGLGFWLTISTAQHNAWHRGDTQYINTCWVNVYQKRVTLFSSFWAMFYSSDILATGLEPVETPGLAAPHSSCLLPSTSLCPRGPWPAGLWLILVGQPLTNAAGGGRYLLPFSDTGRRFWGVGWSPSSPQWWPAP